MLPDLQRILNSGQVTNNGPFVQQFETALTKHLGIPTIVFSSGMAALIAMLRAVDVARGQVLCPSFTFAATPHAIVLAGGTPVFADVDPENLSLCLDPQLFRNRYRYVKAVLAVDPYGICWDPPDWPYTIPILIDSAPSFGSDVRDLPPVDRAAAQIFSFHATKPFSTMEGGALCSRDEDLIRRAKVIRNFGQEADGDCAVVGFNGKMLEVCAAVGLRQLEDWGFRSHSRSWSASRLREGLRGIEGLRVQETPPGQRPVWVYLPVFIEPEFGKSRDDVVAELAGRGIQARIYYRACHELSCYAGNNVRFPVTERLAAQVISLSVYDNMTGDEIGYIAQAFREIRNG